MIGRDVVWQRDLKRPGPADDVDPQDAPVREGVTRCRLRHVFGDQLLVELEPMTGRKHQLRQESALRLGPIVGDRRYGSTEAFSPGIALHASLLTFAHPINEAEVRIVDPLPPSWRRFHLPREATSFDR
jgi:23S rRNA-/tRNA-specific pseudouridylate synthase